MQERKPKGLKLRGEVWWIDKTVRRGDERIQLRESTGCRSLEDARRVLERRCEQVRAGEQQPTTIGGERTFAEAAAEYIVNLESRGKTSGRALQDINLLVPSIGALPLSHIHQRTLQPWIDAQKGVRASGTVDRALRTASTVLHFAAEVLRDGNQPWLAIAPPRLSSPDWGARQPRPITWEEQDRLVEKLPAHLVGPVLLALATGARQAEITTLSWRQHRQLDGLPKWAAWWIPPEVRKGNSRKSVSQQDGRYLVCNRAARMVIERQVGKDTEVVFPSPKKEGYRGLYRVNNNGWRRACKDAGLPIRFHDLRHTFGERAADCGIPLDIRRSLLGHEHRDITLHYSSPGLARLLEEVERITRPAVRLAAVG